MLAHPAHAAYLVTKLWNEFVATPPDAATVQALAATYTGGGLKLKPLLQQILGDKAHLRVARRADHGEAADRLRRRDAAHPRGGRSATRPASDHLDAMGQLPYFPPTVAGWEGGLSWLNTNTALARFAFAGEALQSR